MVLRNASKLSHRVFLIKRFRRRQKKNKKGSTGFTEYIGRRKLSLAEPEKWWRATVRRSSSFTTQRRKVGGSRNYHFFFRKSRGGGHEPNGKLGRLKGGTTKEKKSGRKGQSSQFEGVIRSREDVFSKGKRKARACRGSKKLVTKTQGLRRRNKGDFRGSRHRELSRRPEEHLSGLLSMAPQRGEIDETGGAKSKTSRRRKENRPKHLGKFAKDLLRGVRGEKLTKQVAGLTNISDCSVAHEVRKKKRG